MASSGSAPPFTPTADTGGSTPTLGATSSSSQTVNPVAPVPADITRVPESGTLLLLGLGLVGLAGVARKLKK